MSDVIIFFLSLCIAVLIIIVLYQQFMFHKGIQKNLMEAASQLEEILDNDSDEKVMVFTNQKSLMDLAAQINRLLEKHQKIRVDYQRSQLTSKKMLSNISHDIKTPMTVILGYLEIMQISHADNAEMLTAVECKAQKVMELINQFFTLAKLEAGDTNIELSKININECCRENVLEFYELLTQKEILVDVEIPEHPIFVQGNKDALQRILFNLISNGIRYGADGKYLGVSVRSDENMSSLISQTRGKVLKKHLQKLYLTGCLPWRIPETGKFRGMGWALPLPKI